MPRDLLSMLTYEAKRQPELAALVASIDDLTEDEIRATPVKLPWLRTALLMLKREHAAYRLSESLDQWVTRGHTPDPVGEMRRWEAGDTFIRVGRSHLQICCGQLVWFDQTGVWIDTIRATLIDPMLWSQTVSCGNVRRSEYMMAVRARAKQLCPETVTAEPMERVRFFRPG